MALPTYAQFALVDRNGAEASICIAADEPVSVRLAVEDLVRDVEKITGRRLTIVDGEAACGPSSVILASMDVAASRSRVERLAPQVADALRDKWEAYRVQDVPDGRAQRLLIAGSNERGTIFGLYRFIEEYLGVDPMYFWTQREPARRDTLEWDSVSLSAEEPTFHYRGWFLNDEDLLVAWKWNGEQRFISYLHYHQVTAPEVHERVFEAMLRLGMNLVIPASFNDITNPAEAKAIELAARRGLFVSMHHIEPLGVSGYAYENYWNVRGDRKEFSIVKHPEAFEEVWRHYAAQWARYPNVVWQLGLRGIADRPIWASDRNAPKSDAGRGKLISDAIALQWEIVREVDKRPHPPATTTLWMEGATLHREGHLTFPRDVGIIFADNSPGWTWQSDFYEVPRQEDRQYGVYYHHQLWGSGPHLAAAVSPQKVHTLMGEVVERGATHYAVLNVGNVREFALGLAASAEMLRNYSAFDPEEFMRDWAKERFGPAADAAVDTYQAYFGSYFIEEINNWAQANERQSLPSLLDGQLRARGRQLISRLISHVSLKNPASELPDPEQLKSWLAGVQKQRAGLEETGARAARVQSQLQGADRAFFEADLLAQQRIMLGLTRMVEAAIHAVQAERSGNREQVLLQAREAASAMKTVREGQALVARGRFENWYRGDRKMNLGELAALIDELLRVVESEASASSR